jgi:hypothetical protein
LSQERNSPARWHQWICRRGCAKGIFVLPIADCHLHLTVKPPLPEGRASVPQRSPWPSPVKAGYDIQGLAMVMNRMLERPPLTPRPECWLKRFNLLVLRGELFPSTAKPRIQTARTVRFAGIGIPIALVWRSLLRRLALGTPALKYGPGRAFRSLLAPALRPGPPPLNHRVRPCHQPGLRTADAGRTRTVSRHLPISLASSAPRTNSDRTRSRHLDHHIGTPDLEGICSR